MGQMDYPMSYSDEAARFIAAHNGQIDLFEPPRPKQGGPDPRGRSRNGLPKGGLQIQWPIDGCLLIRHKRLPSEIVHNCNGRHPVG
jgi:hypothetical protein